MRWGARAGRPGPDVGPSSCLYLRPRREGRTEGRGGRKGRVHEEKDESSGLSNVGLMRAAEMRIATLNRVVVVN